MLVMHQHDEGALFLTDDEARQYHRTLAELHSVLAPKADLSETTIDAALRRAVFETLDLRGSRGGRLESRLDAAVDGISTLALRSVVNHECLIEVCGLDPASLPARFGPVRFIHFNRYQLRKLRRAALPDGHRDSIRRRAVHQTTQRLSERCFGGVTVPARDDRAAQDLATRVVRLTTDCLNFFTDLVPYNHGWAFLPGDRERGTALSAVLEPDGTLHCRMSRTDPMGLFSMARLRKLGHLRSIVTRVSELLARQRNPVEELLLTAVQTAGRATVERRPEDSFLLYAIALESLSLPVAAQELRYRLAQRVARLLAGGTGQRIDCNKQVKGLYDVRSKIVHSGSSEIDARDHDMMRTCAKRAILRMLAHPGVAACTTTQALDEWFENRALS